MHVAVLNISHCAAFAVVISILPKLMGVNQGAKAMQAVNAYNVFMRKQQPALRCAVAQDGPVPRFIQSETWEFGGTLSSSEPIPLGFHPRAAQDATKVMGYYLFHALASG